MRSEIFKIKAMTERVVQQDHSERAVYGGSGLWEYCMKTIPELYVEEMTEMMPHQNQFRIRTERIEKTKSARIDRNVIRKITKMAEEVRMARRVISLNLH